jgi:large subunit ribosomal protein L3
MRTGLIAEKIGMSCIYDADGRNVPVTLLKVGECQVTKILSKERNGYTALQIGVMNHKPKKVKKPQREYFAKSNLAPTNRVKEFRVTEECLLNLGDIVTVDHFVKGQYIDVSGVSIGKGFAGVIKRWGFAGLRASHGVSVSHRSHGSTGQCQDPGKVMKGKKMAGHMGAESVTTQNIKIIDVLSEEKILVVKGAIPGHKGAVVYIRDAIKRSLPETAPYPAGLTKSENDLVKANSEGFSPDSKNGSNEAVNEA